MQKIKDIYAVIYHWWKSLDDVLRFMICILSFFAFIVTILISLVSTDYEQGCKEYAELYQIEYRYIGHNYNECFVFYKDEWITDTLHEVKQRHK